MSRKNVNDNSDANNASVNGKHDVRKNDVNEKQQSRLNDLIYHVYKLAFQETLRLIRKRIKGYGLNPWLNSPKPLA